MRGMKIRFTVRDMAWLVVVVAMLMGWIMDHLSEAKVIRLYQAGEDRLVDNVLIVAHKLKRQSWNW
jgi:hypothetical protein